MPKVKFFCKECGREGETWPSQARQFCSQSCRGRYLARETTMPLKPRTGRYDPCAVCGTPVWRRQHQIRDDVGRFCSKACRDRAQTKERVEFTCEACGNCFSLKPSQAQHQAGRFCSRACQAAGRIRRPLDREHNGKPARLDRHGYVWVWEPGNPDAVRYKGWVAEHRLVAERLVGRPLTSADEVHHINRIRDDNRPENLEVLDSVTHARITKQQRETDRELLAKYIERFGPLD